ncbi:MAG TPA: transglutaminase domain-containing protein [Jatrophihabitans sp.]|nr:transglutaminase domain-containing protein [Jatrophihabitans sp.]
MNVLRRALPYTLLPLSLIACGLASAPWLRAFPSNVLAVPLFGAALLSVIAPLIVVGIGVRPLWLTALIDLVLGVFYELLATLREPFAFDHLWSGLVHGPSQILSFALPLVSPRELMVAPVALCWLTGAVIGECVARGWQSVLPYLGLLVTFGLAYAGTVRAVTSVDDGRRYDTLLAAALLVTLLLLRAAQAWVVQDESAEMTQPDGMMPLRGLAIGAVLSLVITALAAGLVQSSSFTGQPATPARTPPVDEGRPLTPVAFVAGLRPNNPTAKGTPLFKVTTDRAGSRYIELSSVNFYDGDGWSFDRTFRPSGGVVPADADVTMRPKGPAVSQTYTIGKGAMTTVPWMPYESRVRRVTGVGVNIDPDSGMVVPANMLHTGEQYTVRSQVPSQTFDDLTRSAQIGTSALAGDLGLAGDLQAPLATLVQSLATETGTSTSDPVAFLQAVAKQFRTKSALAGAPVSPSASGSVPGGRFLQPVAVKPTHKASHKPSHKPSRKPSSHPPTSHSASPSSPASSSASRSPHTGGTTFADVLASIRADHSATPEQYATLMALIARKLLVPVRVVTGFRLPAAQDGSALPAGTYTVTTAEAWTWVEIPIRDQGWVVLDPSPGTYAGRPPTPPAGTTPSSTPSSSPAPSAALTNGNEGNAPAPKSPITHHHSITTTSLVVLIAVVLAAMIVLVLLGMLLRKWTRVRRRRRPGDPRRRLLGAWHESLDFLVEAGLPEPRSMTSAEVAAATNERFGGEPAAQVRYIGDAANLAIFSPTSWVGPAEADAAWRAQAVLARTVRRRLDWRRRIGTRFRYHRNRRPTPLIAPASWTAAARARAAAGRGGKHTHRRVRT